jgi:hypothetical protein
MGQMRLAASSAVAAVLLALGLAACHPGGLHITTTPSLYPAFQTTVVDYVNRCDPETPTQVSVTTPTDTTVSVNGEEPQSGTFTVEVTQDVGKRFTIEVTVNDQTSTHHVRCLPLDFPNFEAERTGTPTGGLYATMSIDRPFGGFNYPTIYDDHGVPVWWLDERLPSSLWTTLGNGHFGTITNNAVAAGGSLREYDLDGKVVHEVNTVNGDEDGHDLLLLPNGNYVAATLQPQPCDLSSWGKSATSTCVNHVFQELTPEGALVWFWDTAIHIPVAETTQPWREDPLNDGEPEGERYDPWHYNSIEPVGDDYIISFRHLDAVYRIDGTTGVIEWKLGGTPRAESLTVVGDPAFGTEGGFSGQHDARWPADGTLTLYDNATKVSARPSRAVAYAIDPEEGTATLLEDVRDAGVPKSYCCGSARRLGTGNWVIGWGSTNTITESEPDGTRVLTVRPGFIYRGTPVPAGELSIEDLRAGMDVQYSK